MRYLHFFLLSVLCMIFCACPTASLTDDGASDPDAVAEDSARADASAEPTPDVAEDSVADVTNPSDAVDSQPEITQDPPTDNRTDVADSVADGDTDIGSDLDADTSDPTVDVDLGPPCASNQDCASYDGTTCVLSEASPIDLVANCRPTQGELAHGAACSAHGDCASGMCLLRGVCLGPCETNEDCTTPGDQCLLIPFRLDPGAEIVTASVCLPNYGSMDLCANSGECTAEACTLFLDGWEDHIEQRCATIVGTETDGDCTSHATCQTNMCMTGDLCFWPCADDAACSADRNCTGITFDDDLETNACIRSCVTTTDCPAGDVCDAYPDIEPPNELALLCFGEVGDRISGQPCDADSQCATGFCSDTECIGPCDPATNDGCFEDTICYPNWISMTFDPNDTPTNTTDDLYDSYPTCLPDMGSHQPCTTDAECPASGEFCEIYLSKDRTAFDLRCRDYRFPGQGEAGAACTEGSQCLSGSCFSDRYCYGGCDTSAECAGGSTCESVDLRLDFRGTPTVDEDDITQTIDLCYREPDPS